MIILMENGTSKDFMEEIAARMRKLAHVFGLSNNERVVLRSYEDGKENTVVVFFGHESANEETSRFDSILNPLKERILQGAL